MPTILVVDDDELMRESVRSALEAHAYTVEEAATGLEAEARLNTLTPDLILSDIYMPGMDGHELLRRLRADPGKRVIPVVFMSGNLQLGDLNDVLRNGIDGVIVKPFRSQQLVDAVASVLERARLASTKSEEALSLLQSTLSRALPHEINTPLHQIDGFAQLLRDTGAANDPQELSLYAEKVSEGVHRLKIKLEKLWLLLDLESRALAARQGGSAERASSSPLSIIAGATVRESAATWKRTPRLPAPFPAAGVLLADRDVANVLHELLENAFQFSPADSVVEVSWSEEPSTVTITIADRGRGMTMAEVQDLKQFSQFQVDRFAKRGHGFGLSIVHRILDLNRGSIKISSEPGRGTTVSVTLPKARSEP